TPTANGCQRPLCTASNVPAGCLYACPTCGDGGAPVFPETCEIGAGGVPFCTGDTLCDARCRSHTCVTSNSCATPLCDAAAGVCKSVAKADDTPCDSDANVCDGVGTCTSGVCHPTPGSSLQCDDHNPCTG